MRLDVHNKLIFFYVIQIAIMNNSLTAYENYTEKLQIYDQ